MKQALGVSDLEEMRMPMPCSSGAGSQRVVHGKDSIGGDALEASIAEGHTSMTTAPQ